jgi:hypothetical protein
VLKSFLEIVVVKEGDAEEEAELHKRFEKLRYTREWFFYEGKLKEYVEGLMGGTEEESTQPTEQL